MATLAPSSGYRGSSSPRRRATSLLLAAGLVLLVLLALIRLGQFTLPDAREQPRLSTFDVAPAPTIAGARAPLATHAKQAVHGAKPPPPARPTPPPPPQPLPQPTVVLPGVIMLNRDQFAASDVSRLHGPPHDATAAGDGQGQGHDAGEGDSPAVGNGPNGEKMYAVDWYRRPTHAELTTYLPHTAPEGAWGEVACRTIERYHVEDCREIGEAPAGSGMSRAVRQAAFQFLVRPPRIGGRSLIGSWVRIRITLSPDGDG